MLYLDRGEWRNVGGKVRFSSPSPYMGVLIEGWGGRERVSMINFSNPSNILLYSLFFSFCNFFGLQFEGFERSL